MKTKITLLTWMAVNNDPNALESLLKKLSLKYDVEKVVYLYQKEYTEKLEKVLPLSSAINPIEVNVKNPTAHKEIYEIIKREILPMVNDEPNLFINVSSGTPAMHSVWLILYAGGVFPKGTRLISSQINRNTGATACDNVDFPIDTYLSELRRYERENPKEAIYKPEYVKSEARKKALEQIRVYASIQGVPMLLLGERGIGKSRLVESIVSKIKKKDVVSVACGTLDSNLAESAMFGHKKGSFTGATADKKGYFGEADGKILFLDEIQDLPKGVQRKLLRTLQDKKHRYRIVGDDKESTADVELVCASNLTDSELRKKLDPDFYDRISFYRVVIPPLRECREDIETDWNEVWKTVRLDSSPKEAPMDKYLEKYFRTSRLSGNFRTLQSIAYQFIAWNGKKTIEEILKDLPADDSPNGTFDIGEFSEFQNLNWKEATKLFQQKLAKYSCDKYGTQEAAAQKLDCTSKTLQNALKS